MNTKTRKQTLRQRLRVDAAKELDVLVGAARKALNNMAAKSGIGGIELGRMVGSSQTDSLEKALITKLADRKEAELEKIYNTQQSLLSEESEK